MEANARHSGNEFASIGLAAATPFALLRIVTTVGPLQKRLTGECLQLHGGYGFMMEYPIALDYADAAVQSIYAGTNEIMKVIIARRMGLG